MSAILLVALRNADSTPDFFLATASYFFYFKMSDYLFHNVLYNNLKMVSNSNHILKPSFTVFSIVVIVSPCIHICINELIPSYWIGDFNLWSVCTNVVFSCSVLSGNDEYVVCLVRNRSYRRAAEIVWRFLNDK